MGFGKEKMKRLASYFISIVCFWVCRPKRTYFLPHIYDPASPKPFCPFINEM